LQTCLAILQHGWSPAVTIKKLVSEVFSILLAPDVDNPLDSAKAEEYYADRASFIINATNHTATHASKSVAQHVTDFGIVDDAT
jgi:ubiquitin-protein ligase